MSSILKALEKVDESQRRRPAGTGGLPKGRGRRPAWLIPAWALGGAAVATLATYALMGGFARQPAQVAQRDSAAASAAVAASAVLPAAVAKPAAEPVAEAAAKQASRPANGAVAEMRPEPVAKAAAIPLTQSATRATANAVAPPHASAKAAGKELSRPVAKATVLPAASFQPAPVLQAAVQPEPAPAAAPAVQQKSRPDIRVTGIAWQGNGESSFAMINGRAMRQGNTVDGYKVEQIYEDSVRFSNNKVNSLVVPLGAGEQ